MERLREVPDCEVCRKLSRRNRHPPKCEDPDRGDCVPPLDPANQDAFNVWTRCKRQFIMGVAGPIDIRHNAIWQMIDELHIKNRLGCFEKVAVAAGAEIAAIHEEKDDS